MRIALISEHASPITPLGASEAGGQNRHVRSLGMALADRGHGVVIYTRRTSQDQPAVVRLRPGLDVVHVPAGPPAPVPRDKLGGLMGEFGNWLVSDWNSVACPHVVHAHFWMSGIAALPVCRNLNIPFIQTFHALGSVKHRYQGTNDTSPPGRQWIEQFLAEEADAVIATCADEVNELSTMNVDGSHIQVIPCGVDLEIFTPTGPSWPRPQHARYRIAYVGRLVERKGIDTIVRALAGIPGTELVIAGGLPAAVLGQDADARRIMATAQECGVRHRIQLTGQIAATDVPALLRSADLVVAVPAYEPFGMVPLEAMACGVPVVASAVGGMRGTVLDGVTGRQVPPGDVEALRRALLSALSDADWRRWAGKRAVEAAQRYSWTSIAERTEDVYARLTPADSLTVPGRQVAS
ncbi:MAG: glycosyltransferase [Micromonosporaceae bacterium]|nr:glycosyltransferase [Micromonosporaceae bacterium]